MNNWELGCDTLNYVLADKEYIYDLEYNMLFVEIDGDKEEIQLDELPTNILNELNAALKECYK